MIDIFLFSINLNKKILFVSKNWFAGCCWLIDWLEMSENLLILVDWLIINIK